MRPGSLPSSSILRELKSLESCWETAPNHRVLQNSQDAKSSSVSPEQMCLVVEFREKGCAAVAVWQEGGADPPLLAALLVLPGVSAGGHHLWEGCRRKGACRCFLC